MKHLIPLLVLFFASQELIAENKSVTLDEVSKLTKTTTHSSNEIYEVKIDGIGKIDLKPQSGYESKDTFGDQFMYPTEYGAPEVTSDRRIPIVPSTPKTFNTTSIGYHLKLKGKRVGSVIYIFGNVERKDFVCFKKGVGELSGEIASNDHRRTLSKNIINQPVFQTVSSAFVLSALPDKTYEIPIWNGKKFVNKKVTVKVIIPKS
jgi:hypothetical protein